MDNFLQQQLEQLNLELKHAGGTSNDPVAKLMLTALLNQARKIQDDLERIPAKIIERLCSTFVPKQRIDAIPAICMVNPSPKIRRDASPFLMTEGAYFSYKIDPKLSLPYYPIYKNLFLPFENTYLLTPKYLEKPSGRTEIQFGKEGQVWLGLELCSETDTLHNASFLIKGTGGIMPKKVTLALGDEEIAFSSADQFDRIDLAEPFDSQQMNSGMLEVMNIWQRDIADDTSSSLLYITDSRSDRDLFKCCAYPKVFRHYMESNDLDMFGSNILWIMFDFGNDYVVPDGIEIMPNVIPVANVMVNHVNLTQTAPIARLDKNDGTFFMTILESPLTSQRQGFNENKEGFTVRDFDVSTYDADELYRDVRVLYNRFVDDYHAFIEYHGLKDGESLRALREMVNRIAKSVSAAPDNRKHFDNGTYAMRNIKMSEQPATVKVSFLTTAGKLGNAPKAGSVMENRKDAALGKDVTVVSSASCGTDKVSVDTLYEMLRYYTLTVDRLYTKMDIDAFVRLQIAKEFGPEEAQRINHTIEIHGAGGQSRLLRGLYIRLSFKDSKNYEKARLCSFDIKLKQGIEHRACLSMPVIINMIDDEHENQYKNY